MGQPGTGAHIGAGFEQAPEMSTIAFKALFAEGALTSFDASAVEFKSLGWRSGGFGQEHIGVGAIRRNGECLPGQGNAPFQVRNFPGLIDEVLRFAE